MSCTLEKNEKNVATVKIEIGREDFQNGIEAAFQKNKTRFVVDGFRKGKAPRSIVERKYGKGLFYEDAIDEAFPKAYTDCVKEFDFSPCAAPKLISVEEVGEDGAKITVEISLQPEFELGDYSDIKVGSIEYSIQEEDLDQEIKALQDKNSRMITVEDASQNEDTVMINFEGFVDDVAFEGGKGENYPLVLGSNTFIPGFEDQLIGKKAGDQVDVTVTFPEEYQAEALAGKEALFKVDVLDVKRKEYPELDDDLAIDLGYESLQAMKDELNEKIVERKTNELKQSAEDQMIETLIERSAIDIPPQLLLERSMRVKEDYEARLKGQGIDPDTYYQYMMQMNGTDDLSIFETMFQDQALKDIQKELIIKKVVETENIEVTEEDLEASYMDFANRTGQSVEDFKATLNDYIIDYLKSVVAQEKACDLLVEKAIKE